MTGPFEFPWGSASARRVDGLARTIALCGYDVLIGSAGREPTQPVELPTSPNASITYKGLNEFPTATHRIRRGRQWLFKMGSAAVRELDALEQKPSHIVVYGGGLPYLLHLIPWCNRNEVPLLLDVVEWHDPRALPGGPFGPAALGDLFARRRLQKHAAGFVVISTLLEDHYRQLHVPVIRVPPTMDIRARRIGQGSNDPSAVVIGYAGTPGKKDELGAVVRAVGVARESRDARLTLEVLGPSRDEVLTLSGLRSMPEYLVVHGRVPQEAVPEFVGRCDFTVLMREDKRSSHAGFPTKFVESLSVGTPVIANITSDLGSYLVDGENGVIVRGIEEGDLVEAFTRAASDTPLQRQRLRTGARCSSEQFDFRRYSSQVMGLLGSTRGASTPGPG